MADIKSLLDGMIEKEIENVKSLKSGTNERSSAVKDLTALHKLRIEEIKAQAEADEKAKRREMDSEHHEAELAIKERELDDKRADRTLEEEFRIRQLKEQVIDRFARIGMTAGELILPLICYGIWMNRGFEFEKTGSFTSTTFKNLLNRFRPTK